MKSLGIRNLNCTSLFLPYCGLVVTSQLQMVEETEVPGENNRPIPNHLQLSHMSQMEMKSLVPFSDKRILVLVTSSLVFPSRKSYVLQVMIYQVWLRGVINTNSSHCFGFSSLHDRDFNGSLISRAEGLNLAWGMWKRYQWFGVSWLIVLPRCSSFSYHW